MKDSKLYTLMSAKGSTGVDKIVDCQDFKHAIFSFATDGGADANLTAKICGSIEETAPTFTSAQSASNMYDFIQSIDYESGNNIDGDTGFSVAGADDYVLREINANGLKWLTVRITARTQGELTVKVRLFNNE